MSKEIEFEYNFHAGTQDIIVEIIAVPKSIEKFGKAKPRMNEALSGTFSHGSG